MDGNVIVTQYLTAMALADGAAVRSLFTEDGVIDDYRGGHRRGGAVIEEYMNGRPARTIDLVGDIVIEGCRITAYTRMAYGDGRDLTVRFIFTMVADRIGHLCNSSVEFVPDELRRDPQPLVHPGEESRHQ